MRTTVDIPDPLLQRAKVVTAQSDFTLRSLIISALERELNCRSGSENFKMRDGSVGDENSGPVSSEQINEAIDEMREPIFVR